MSKISWAAFVVWIFIWLGSTAIIVDEELGITHVLGLNPITWDAVGDPRLFLAIALAGPVFTAWWLVHVYRRKYGDLSKR